MAVPTTAPPVETGFEASDAGLKRTMSTTQLLMLGVGAQIGSGWLFAVLSAAGIAGPAAIASWVIAAVLFMLVALAWMELGSMLPRSGAIVRYPHLTHGAFTGWIMGWGYWLSAVTIPALEAVAVLTYLGGKFPGTGFLTTKNGVTLLAWPNGILAGIGIMLLFLGLNLVGIKALSETNRWITLWKIIIPTLTFVGLFFVFHGSNFTAFGGFAPLGASGIFKAIAVAGIAFSYLGFRQALDFGGECRNPRRAIVIATAGSIIIPMIIYTLLQVAFLGAIDWQNAGIPAGSWSDLAGSSWASGPFFKALEASGLAALVAFGNVLLADAAISPTGTGWIYLGTTTRVGYALSVQRYVPKLFCRVNRFGIPAPAAIAAFVVGCVFFLPLPSWYKLVGFISAAAVLSYVMGGAGLPVLRRTAPELHRPFRLPQASLWSGVGFVASMLVVYWAGFSTLVNLLVALFIGMPVFSAYTAVRNGWMQRVPGLVLTAAFVAGWVYLNDRGGWVLAGATQRSGTWPFPAYDGAFCAAVIGYCLLCWWLCDPVGRRHVAASSWLIGLLLATFTVSYYGEYGPSSAAPLPFPYGTLIMIGVSALCFLWAVRSGFATEEIRAIVATEGPGTGRGHPDLAAAPSPE
jgi:amino acid transporter